MPENILGAQAVGMNAIRYVPEMNLEQALESLLVSE
jgi:hypothetical protein